MQAHSAIHPITCNNREHAINPYHPELVQGQEPEPSQLRERSGRERGGHVDYVMVNSHTTSHSTTLNLILSPDPDPEQSGLLKGGGGREGWNMWVILYMHNINSHTTSLSTNFKPDPESRAPPENIVLCRNKTEKLFKDQNK